MGVRKEAYLKKTRKLIEKENARNKKLLLGGWVSTVYNIVGYLILFLLVSGIGGPLFLVNYVKNQVQEGEWIDVSQSAASTDTTDETHIVSQGVTKETANEDPKFQDL
uniref:Uncharacterized protein n=1 Tax=Strombidium rassoulzadegani TaxID=1082188 RepID=A0A7S3FVF1_9SPIT|mmetsp:Transcript_4654/g.7900  ORF Transcript_4654/g.7900 Transcript_4654/m.7900 type:complete len:108 (+) Transcript_4654:1586-1909(+)